MKRLFQSLPGLIVLLSGACLTQAQEVAEVAKIPEAERYWGQWRGPFATGVAPHANPPLEWSEEKNIRWKVPIPGRGHSTPVVWKDRIYLTTAIPFGDPVEPKPDLAPGAHDNVLVTHHQRFAVLAIRRSDGAVLWQRQVAENLPHAGGHATGSLASNSPVTDGEHLIAFFGSHGLYGLDAEGEILWQVDLGLMQSKHGHGEASSPAMHGDAVVISWDHEGSSFAAAFDKNTGEQRWRVERDEVTSWASPIVIEIEGTPQVVIPGTRRLRGYDLETGRVLWECAGLSHNIVASPVFADGMLFSGSSYERQIMLALRLDGAKGDLTSSDHLAWVQRRLAPYVPSPLLYGNLLYYLSHYQGILSRIEVQTGKAQGRALRLGGIGNIYASPVAAAGRVYITDLDGATLVLQHGETPLVLALNQLDDSFAASAALVGEELYLRGARSLYCIASE